MIESKKVSIIIPVYNLEGYISKCLESVMAQTYKNIEIVVIDDGSSDNTQEIIKEKMKVDSRIKYVFQKNSGVSSARNKGIDKSEGEYILFVDADDYIKKDMIEKLYSEINKNQIVVSRLSNENAIVSNKSYIIDVQLFLKDIMMGNNSQTACGILFEAELIKKHNIRFRKDFKYGEDFIFTIEYVLNIQSKIIFIDEKFYFVEERIGSASRNFNIDIYKDISKLCFYLMKNIKSKGYLPLFLKEIDVFNNKNLSMALSYVIKSSNTFEEKYRALKFIKTDKVFEEILKKGDIYSNRRIKLKLKLFYYMPITVFLIISIIMSMRNNYEIKEQ